MPKEALITEEPDLEALFAEAVEEISNQVDDEDFDADYGFQSEWDDQENDDPDEDELELKATKVLFDSISDYPGQEENIERFCLPLFSKSGSDYAVSYVIDAFNKRPSMSQIYASYLSKFLETNEVRALLVTLLKDSALTDWQKMWILAALSQIKPGDDGPVKAAFDLLKDANRHEALRAVAAIYVGRYGDHDRRKALISIYGTVSNHVQTAIYFSSRTWPGVERSNAKASWSAHSPLHGLLTIALGKK